MLGWDGILVVIENTVIAVDAEATSKAASIGEGVRFLRLTQRRVLFPKVFTHYSL